MYWLLSNRHMCWAWCYFWSHIYTSRNANLLWQSFSTSTAFHETVPGESEDVTPEKRGNEYIQCMSCPARNVANGESVRPRGLFSQAWGAQTGGKEERPKNCSCQWVCVLVTGMRPSLMCQTFDHENERSARLYGAKVRSSVPGY